MKNKLLLILLVMLLVLTSCALNNNKITVNAEHEEKLKEEINEETLKIKDEETKIDDNTDKDIDEFEQQEEEPFEEEVVEEIIDEPIENNIIDNSKELIIEETAPSEEQNVLTIQGLVENETYFTLTELKGMSELIYEADFYSLNNFGTTGYTHFKGINLWMLLELKAKISPDASQVTIIAHDGYKITFTVEMVKKQDYIDETNPDTKYPMILAWEEKGVEYDPEEGAPYKLVVGQKEAGDINKPNWVSNIDKIIIE